MGRIAALLLIVAVAGQAWSQDSGVAPGDDRRTTSTADERPRNDWRPPDRPDRTDEWRWRDRYRGGSGDSAERRWPNPRDFRARGNRPWERGGPHFDWQPQSMQRDSGELSSGYVFLQGEYLPPPYRLQVDGVSLRLNGRLLVPLVGDELPLEQRAANRVIDWYDRLREQLQSGAIVLIEAAPANTSGSAPNNEARAQHVIITLPRNDVGVAFLQQIADQETPPQADRLPQAAASFLARYRPEAKLVARVERDLELIERSRTGAVADAPAIGRLTFPLTALGMFLAAVAVGQLFVSRSLLSKHPGGDSPDIARAAVGCILVVMGLSLLDLVWTLLSVRAGIMHELNPLATQFLSSASALTGFKVVITLSGAMILYVLRYHRPAQLAAWWLCMVCTLVTVRWVAFTSLFVT